MSWVYIFHSQYSLKITIRYSQIVACHLIVTVNSFLFDDIRQNHSTNLVLITYIGKTDNL